MNNTDDETSKAALVPIDRALLGDVQVTIEARLGETTLTIAALSGLKDGSVVTLDRSLADHVDLRLNGATIARGEIVAVGDHFGVRIVEVAAD